MPYSPPILLRLEARILGLIFLPRFASKSPVAHHLRTLEEAGLVTSRRDGRSTYYAVQKEELTKHHIFE